MGKMTQIEKKKSGRPTKRPQEELLFKMYGHHTAADIAMLYDVPVGTVRSWIRYYRRKDKAKENE